WHARFTHATDDPGTLPPQDVVFVALKASALPAQAQALAHLLGNDGTAVFLNNGIPWWWNHGRDNGNGTTLELLDPDGQLWQNVRPERALGAVVYSPNEVSSPGVVFHGDKRSNRYILGEPSNVPTSRLDAIVGVLKDAGLAAEASGDVRRNIWEKLLINVGANPLSALTRLNSAQLSDDPEIRRLRRELVSEVTQIASAMGWPTINPPQTTKPQASASEAQVPEKKTPAR